MPEPQKPTEPPTEHPPQPAAEPIEAEIVVDPPDPTALTPTPPPPPTGYTDAGVPTLDYVRDKIEGRSATAMGWEELAAGTEQARAEEELFAEREAKAKAKLDDLRKQLGL